MTPIYTAYAKNITGPKWYIQGIIIPVENVEFTIFNINDEGYCYDGSHI